MNSSWDQFAEEQGLELKDDDGIPFSERMLMAIRSSAPAILSGAGLSADELRRRQADKVGFLQQTLESVVEASADIGALWLGTLASGGVLPASIMMSGVGAMAIPATIKDAYYRYAIDVAEGKAKDQSFYNYLLSFETPVTAAKEAGKAFAGFKIAKGLGNALGIDKWLNKLPAFSQPLSKGTAEALIESGTFAGIGSTLGEGTFKDNFVHNLGLIGTLKLSNSALMRLANKGEISTDDIQREAERTSTPRQRKELRQNPISKRANEAYERLKAEGDIESPEEAFASDLYEMQREARTPEEFAEFPPEEMEPQGIPQRVSPELQAIIGSEFPEIEQPNLGQYGEPLARMQERRQQGRAAETLGRRGTPFEVRRERQPSPMLQSIMGVETPAMGGIPQEMGIAEPLFNLQRQKRKEASLALMDKITSDLGGKRAAEMPPTEGTPVRFEQPGINVGRPYGEQGILGEILPPEMMPQIEAMRGQDAESIIGEMFTTPREKARSTREPNKPSQMTIRPRAKRELQAPEEIPMLEFPERPQLTYEPEMRPEISEDQMAKSWDDIISSIKKEKPNPFDPQTVKTAIKNATLLAQGKPPISLPDGRVPIMVGGNVKFAKTPTGAKRMLKEKKKPLAPESRKVSAEKLPESKSQVPKSKEEAKNEKPISQKEIIGAASRLFAIPVRSGEGIKKGAQGVYKGFEEVIRLSSPNDLATLAHELGHHIDKKLFGRDFREGYDAFKPYEKELSKFGTTEVQEGQAPESEQFANFVEAYINDPVKAKLDAPKFFKFFEDSVSKFPNAKQGLKFLQEQARRYKMQTPMGRMMAQMEPEKSSLWQQFRRGEISPKKFIKDTFDYLGNKFMTEIVDVFHPIREQSEEAYTLFRLYKGVGNNIAQWYTKAPKYFNFAERWDKGESIFRKDVKGLTEILKPFWGKGADHLKEFQGFLIAKRIIELDKRRGKEGEREIFGISDHNVSDAHQVVKDYGKQYDKVADELYKYQDSVLEYYKDSGMISQEVYQKMRDANKAYVPFYRVFEEGSGLRLGKGMVPSQKVKKIKGSERYIVDPLESIIKNTSVLVSIAEKNRAMKTLVKDIAGKEGGGKFAEILDSNPIDVQEKIANLLQERKLEGADVAGIDPQYLESLLSPLSDGKNIVSFYENGKRYRVQVDPEIYNAVIGMDPVERGLLTKILTFPTKTLRYGATITPEFIASNMIRDGIEANLYSQFGNITPMNLVKATQQLFKGFRKTEQTPESEYIDALEALGGVYGASPLLTAGGVNNALLKYSKNASKLKKFIVDDFFGLQKAAEISELAPRLVEFEKGVQKLGKGGAREAALAAREVTLDFQRQGASISLANQFIAFLNAYVQGQYKFWSTFGKAGKDLLKGELKSQEVAKFGLKMASTLAVPTVMLTALNAGQDWYDDIEDWEKAQFWHFKAGKTVYRIPKPREIGVWGANLPQAVVEYMHKKDPKAVNKFAEQVLDSLSMNVVPTFAAPFIEDFANKSLFTGRSLAPGYGKEVANELMYTPFTSELSKYVVGKIGDIFNVGTEAPVKFIGLTPFTPAKLENYVRSWSGSLGSDILNYTDTALRKSGALPDHGGPFNSQNLPLLKRFTRKYPGSNSQAIRDFWDNYATANTVSASIKEYQKEGKYDKARKLSESYKQWFPKSSHKAMTKIRDTIKNIREMDIPDSEKQIIIDQLYLQMIGVAQIANKDIKTVRDLMTKR